MSAKDTNRSNTARTAAGAATAAAGGATAMRRTSWGAIFVGAVVAAALMIFFSVLGIGIGVSTVNPTSEQNPVSGLGTGSGIWLVVTQLLSLFAGGYAAAKLAGVPRVQASLLHGGAVWALATLALTWAAISGGGAAFGAASSVLRSSVSATADAGQAVIPDNMSLPNPQRIASNVSINDLPPQLQQALRQQGITDQQLRQEAQSAFRNVFSQQEQQRARQQIRQAAVDAVRSPGDTRSDLQETMDSLVGGENAVISQEDRQEAMTQMEQRLGIEPQQAEQVIDRMQQQVEQAVQQARQAANQAIDQAVQAAEQTADAIGSAALLVSVASLLGFLAALGGAFVGKPESVVGSRGDDHA